MMSLARSSVALRRVQIACALLSNRKTERGLPDAFVVDADVLEPAAGSAAAAAADTLPVLVDPLVDPLGLAVPLEPPHPPITRQIDATRPSTDNCLCILPHP